MVGLGSIRKKTQAPTSLGAADICALRLDADDRIVDQSPSAEGLARLWHGALAPFRDAVARARASGLPVEERLVEPAGGSNLWLVVLPEGAGGKDMLVVARDTTLSDKMTEALLKSRTMLKELLEGAVDMVFEVDPQKNFLFLSPADAFGCKTDSWLGRRAHMIFWPDGALPARDPFAARTAATFDAVPVAFDDQPRRWLQFNMRPQHDEAGNLVSLRGTCRDMTKRYLAERQTRVDNLRLSLLHRITELLNTEERAQDLLDSASKELVDILRADMVWAVVKYVDGLVPVSIEGEHQDILDIEGIWQTLKGQQTGVVTIHDRERQHLAIRLERGETDLGMVIVSRDTVASPWSQQEEQLLGAVAGVLTAAFGKAELIDKLYRLSSKDELTGLLNRRALAETIERKLKHQARTGQEGCLLFLDLDYFKEVNDTLGHAAGDTALKLVAQALQAMIRPCDYAGRYGGDEFIVWLEDADRETAARKGKAMIDAMPGIRAELGMSSLKLSASVGICETVAGEDLSFEDLTERADQALYEVKKSGRGTIAFADRKQMAGEG